MLAKLKVRRHPVERGSFVRAMRCSPISLSCTAMRPSMFECHESTDRAQFWNSKDKLMPMLTSRCDPRSLARSTLQFSVKSGKLLLEGTTRRAIDAAIAVSRDAANDAQLYRSRARDRLDFFRKLLLVITDARSTAHRASSSAKIFAGTYISNRPRAFEHAREIEREGRWGGRKAISNVVAIC